MMEPSEGPEAADAETPQIDITKKPGRAFLHKLTGKFLAESGIKSFCGLIKQHEAASTLCRLRSGLPFTLDEKAELLKEATSRYFEIF